MHALFRFLFLLALVNPAAASREAIDQIDGQLLESTRNTRDLGGYTTEDGRRTRPGMLIRSDNLAGLSEADWSVLGQMNLATITDFRSDSERSKAPYELPAQWPPVSRETLNINNPAVDVAELGRKFYAGELTEPELLGLLDRTSYIEDPVLSQAWGRWLRSLAEPDALPHLFHCKAGKDRTGFAAAIVLLTLGVSKEDVMRDFLRSNDHLAPYIEPGVKAILENTPHMQINPDVLRQTLGVSPDSLQGAFDAMEAKYGSIDAYIEQGLGVDSATRQKLQELLLEQ